MPPAHLHRYQQQLNPLWAFLLSPFVWLHAITVKPVVNFWLYPVLGAVEESISSLIREGLALIQRSVNGFSAWVLSVSNRQYKQQLRGRWQELAEQHSWWKDEQHKKSTLNAVLARSYASESGSTQASPNAGGPVTTEVPTSRSRTVGNGDSKQEATPGASTAESDADVPAAAEFPLATIQLPQLQIRKPEQRKQQTEIEAAPETGTEGSEGPARVEHTVDADSGDNTDELTSPRWWPTTPPAWLTAVSEEAQEAAAAAQEAAAAAAAQASAAVQQAATSVSNAVEEAAAAAAAIARNMRAVFEPQAGWGANEAIRRTGLLEDISLFSQLLVNRIFDAIRWFIGSLTFVGTSSTPNSQQSASRAASSWLSKPPAATTSTRSSSPSGTAAAVGAGLAVAGVAAARTARGVTAATGGGAISGGFWAAVKRLLWPWGAAATAGAVTAGAAAAAAKELWDESHKQNAPAGTRVNGEGKGQAPVKIFRRSATSVDLVRSTKMWQSESEAEDSDTESTADTEQTDSGQLSFSFSKPALSTQVPSSSSLRNSATGAESNYAATVLTGLENRVAFAGAGAEGLAEQQQPQQLGPRDGCGSSSRTASPFATANVQEKHHSAISRHEWKQQKGHKGADKLNNGKQQQQQHKKHRKHKGHHHRQPRVQKWSSGSSAGSNSSGRGPLHRTHSGPALSKVKDVSSAGQVIRMAGYPLEVHEIVTPDGYILTMERIPQPGATDVVLMMHGVLDTSLTWVAGGVTGSQAFAAWDRGFDVWLGSSRSNPPHAAADPKRRGSAYWLYTHNECGLYDMGAQIDHIHATKVRELASLGISGSAARVAVGTQGGSSGTQQQQQGSAQQTTAGKLDTAAAGADKSNSDRPADIAQAFAVAASSSVVSPRAPRTPRDAAVAAGQPFGSSIDLHHATSAAEVDAAAAAEAAAAVSKHRAAVAAAGISPDRLAPSTAAGSSSSEGLASWWPGISSITNFSAFNFSSLGGIPRPRLRDRLSRRTGSLDLNMATAAAAAAAAALPAAEAGVGAAGVLGVTAAATVAAKEVKGRGHTLAVPKQQQQQQQQQQQEQAPHGSSVSSLSSSQRSSSSDSSSSSNTLEVSCRIQVPESGDRVSVELVPVNDQPASSAAAAAAGEGQDGSASPAARRAGWPKLSSSSSLRHVLSAPDMSAAIESLDVAGNSAATRGTTAAGPAASSSTVIALQQQQQKQEDQGKPKVEDDSKAEQQQQRVEESTPKQTVASRVADESADHSSSNSSPGSSTSTPQQQQPNSSTSSTPVAAAAAGPVSNSLTGDPYNLRVVAHSLGGFLMLIYCTQRSREGRQHHVKRLVLLSPAGFHVVIPGMFKPLLPTWKGIMYYMAWIWRQKEVQAAAAELGSIMYYMAWIWRQKAFPVHLPTFVARLLAFKVAVDTAKLPAVGDLVKAFARLVLGGDRSAWDRALVMPHYTAAGMPLLSSLQVMHFIQLHVTRRCQLYDHGSIAANVRAYQQPTPPVVSDLYHTLRGVPVHLVAGLHDGVIPPENIKCHFEAMTAAGVDVSYREFEYGHMDFTFSAKEELGYYINSLLMRK